MTKQLNGTVGGCKSKFKAINLLSSLHGLFTIQKEPELLFLYL